MTDVQSREESIIKLLLDLNQLTLINLYIVKRKRKKQRFFRL